MIEVNFDRCRVPPWSHQKQAVRDLILNPVYALFHEQRLGKSKSVIDAACFLHEAGELAAMVVAAPAQVVDVWKDKDLGEIARHCWVDHQVQHFGARWDFHAERPLSSLRFVLVSLEYLRQEGPSKLDPYPKVTELLKALPVAARSWLVVDEASALGNPTSNQTRAVSRLRKGFDRFTLLDGTPAGNSTLAIYSKLRLMDPTILGYKSQRQFKLRHANMGGYLNKQILGWKNLEVITLASAPYVSRVEAKDVLDMPSEVHSFVQAALTPKTWDVYRQLRDDLVAELESGAVTVTTAPVKVLRLAQVCAGFLGGVEPDLVLAGGTKTVELSSDTTDAFLAWLGTRLEERPDFKCVVWCRWRAEIERLLKKLTSLYRDNPVFFTDSVWGGYKGDNFLHPDHPYAGAGVLVCQPQAAAYGVNFSKADTSFFLSQDYNLVLRDQSAKRIVSPGRKTVYSVDAVVTGPRGERTVTHDIRRSLLAKEDLAKRTVVGWKRVLEAE